MLFRSRTSVIAVLVALHYTPTDPLASTFWRKSRIRSVIDYSREDKNISFRSREEEMIFSTVFLSWQLRGSWYREKICQPALAVTRTFQQIGKTGRRYWKKLLLATYWRAMGPRRPPVLRGQLRIPVAACYNKNQGLGIVWTRPRQSQETIPPRNCRICCSPSWWNTRSRP